VENITIVTEEAAPFESKLRKWTFYGGQRCDLCKFCWSVCFCFVAMWSPSVPAKEKINQMWN